MAPAVEHLPCKHKAQVQTLVLKKKKEEKKEMKEGTLLLTLQK
jgi:hypothetical protein